MSLYQAAITASKYGFAAKGFAITALKRQIDFWLGVAVAQANSPMKKRPVFDSRITELMKNKEAGLPEPVELSVEDLTEASAAGFVLLTRHIRTPDPENGKRETFREQWCLTPTEIIARTVEYGVEKAILDAKAQCQQVGADPSKRIDVIVAEGKKRLEALVEPVMVQFVKHVETYLNGTDEACLDCMAEKLADAKKPADQTIRDAVQSYKDAMKKRADDGTFFRVDAGIIAMLDGLPTPKPSKKAKKGRAAPAVA